MMDDGGGRKPVLEFPGDRRKKKRGGGGLWKPMDTNLQGRPINLSRVCQQHSGCVYRISSRKPHTFQCCASAQHKSSTPMNEHPPSAHVGAAELGIPTSAIHQTLSIN